MKYISATKGASMAFVIFVIAVLTLPIFPALLGVELVITISTFIFAILVGFFLSRLNGRYDEIRRFTAAEDANWLAFYKTSQIFGKEFSKRIAALIDEYYIVAYDFYVFESAYKPTADVYFRIWDEVRKIKTTKCQSAYQVLLGQLTEIEKNRNGFSVIAAERLSSGQWIMLFILSILIITSLFNLRTTDLFLQVSVVLLSTLLVLILLIIRDLQNTLMEGKSPIEETGQEIFEFLGKKRYYHQRFIISGITTVPDFVKEYRLGLHAPGAKKFLIKIIKR